jgi:hypothetical protein
LQQNIRIAVLIGTLALGAVASVLTMPTLYPEIPTSIMRVRNILRAIEDPLIRPKLVVLGNSVAMSGIDSRQLAARLEHPGPAYNIAYEGQSLVESYLVQQALGEDVETIVQLVMIHSRAGGQRLQRQKFNNLYMWGYRAPAAAVEKLQAIYGAPLGSILNMSSYAHYFVARWTVQQWADIQIRRVWEDPRGPEYVQSNLTLPVPYIRHNKALDRRVKRRAAAATGEDYRLGATEQQLIQVMVDESRAAGRRLAIVFAPVHPRISGLLFKDDLRALSAYADSLAENEHVSVLDATSALLNEQFYDEIHLAGPGAMHLTRLIADSMAAIR